MSNLLYRSAGLLRRFSLQTLAAVPLLLSMQPAQAFSLLGPKTSWMTPENGYRDVGGPMARDHEYRWNVPVLTYGFDASFRERFGTNGVQAVEAAFALLNALPPMDSITDEVLTNSYPFQARETNTQAATLGLQDLKSLTLSLILKQLGLASPEQSVWVIRQTYVLEGVTNRIWHLRSYDPISRNPADSVNGTIYSHIEDFYGPAIVPLYFSTVAAGNQAIWHQSMGLFFVGLTVDDVGGLRHLYHPQNLNFEVLPPEVRGAGGAAFVNLALRPGVNEIQFVAHDANATTGAFLPMTIPFTDRYVTNGNSLQQALERVIDRPDFLFSASSFPGLYTTTGTWGWTNLGGLNSPPSVPAEEVPGPGVIQGQVQIGISELGPQVVGDTVEYLQWAGFDGTTIHWSSLTNTVTGPVEGKVPLDIPLYQPSGPGTALRLLLSAEYGALLELQSSGDLATWNRQAVVTNYNRPITWLNTMGGTNLFFRVVAPQP